MRFQRSLFNSFRFELFSIRYLFLKERNESNVIVRDMTIGLIFGWKIEYNEK